LIFDPCETGQCSRVASRISAGVSLSTVVAPRIERIPANPLFERHGEDTDARRDSCK
jgi:hypothetical protein